VFGLSFWQAVLATLVGVVVGGVILMPTAEPAR
jgi:purine-cytosine permease-like protein